jgi:hypothetical protein
VLHAVLHGVADNAAQMTEMRGIQTQHDATGNFGAVVALPVYAFE